MAAPWEERRLLLATVGTRGWPQSWVIVVALLHVEPQLKNSNLFIYTFQKITYKDIIAVYKSEGSAEDAPAAVGFKHV